MLSFLSKSNVVTIKFRELEANTILSVFFWLNKSYYSFDIISIFCYLQFFCYFMLFNNAISSSPLTSPMTARSNSSNSPGASHSTLYHSDQELDRSDQEPPVIAADQQTSYKSALVPPPPPPRSNPVPIRSGPSPYLTAVGIIFDTLKMDLWVSWFYKFIQFKLFKNLENRKLEIRINYFSSFKGITKS